MKYRGEFRAYSEAREKQKTRELSFHEQLEAMYDRLPREHREQTVEEREAVKVDLERREAAVNDKELVEVLAAYGIDAEAVGLRECREYGEDVYGLPVKEHFWDRRLPDGYVYQGGAARALLGRAIGTDSRYEPRDVDLLRFSETSTEEGEDDRVSAEFMPGDFATGHGVSVEGKAEFLHERDFTLNELFASDEEIVATRQCLLDTVRRIIRVTDSEREKYGGIGSKMMAKGLRFYAEGIHRFGESTLDIEDAQFERYFISPFWMSLNLDKAFEVGKETAETYVRHLKERGQIPEDINDADEATLYLGELIASDSYYFRHAPVEQFELEEEWAEYEKYPKQS